MKEAKKPDPETVPCLGDVSTSHTRCDCQTVKGGCTFLGRQARDPPEQRLARDIKDTSAVNIYRARGLIKD